MKTTVLRPIDVRLDQLRLCIANGWDEDAQNHLFNLLRGLRCKSKRDDELTPEGRQLKSEWAVD